MTLTRCATGPGPALDAPLRLPGLSGGAMSRGYHVTTPAKLARYAASGRIIRPVRFWPNLATAQRWARRTGRTIILAIDVPGPSYPLPDHKPGRWVDADVVRWEVAA